MDIGAFVDQLATTGAVVGVDSGPSHIATALGLRHVQIYNFPTAWRTGPQPRHGAAHQVSVEGRPTPDVDTVWSAWQATAPMSEGVAARVARFAYATVLRAVAPLYALRVLWRGRREPLYAEHLGERFGRYRTSVAGRRALDPCRLARRDACGGCVDRGPAIGRARPAHRPHATAPPPAAPPAARWLRDGDEQVWLPFDTPGGARRFLRRFKPCAGVLMETEIWPNLLAEARAIRLPVVLANARLSERSRRRGRRVDLVLRPAFESLRGRARAVAGRRRAIARRRRDRRARRRQPQVRHGARSVAARARPTLEGDRATRPVVLAAITREGEEALLLAAWRDVAEPRPLLVIVPRHPQRFEAVAELVDAAGFSLARRSAWPSMPPSTARAADVWLGDSMMEMPAYYALADVALLGGSFLPLGGQNLIEAAACGCPIVMGPHTFNFADAASLSLAAGASLRVETMGEGVALAVSELGSAALAAQADAARAFAASHQGAAVRSAEVIAAISGLEQARAA